MTDRGGKVHPWVRHALYWLPEPGPLAAFGAHWLGWDIATGRALPHPALPGLPDTPAALTEAPRRYGLHATIRPPFRLRAGCTEAALDAAARAFCAGRPAVTVGALVPGAIGPFLALLPEGDQTGGNQTGGGQTGGGQTGGGQTGGGHSALSALAAAAVAALDPFRAPPTPAEIARRNPSALPPLQRALLDRWGYPHVMEAFRFHVTLTGPLAPEAQAATLAALRPALAPLLPRPLRIDALCLCGEGADGRFRLIRRYPLAG
jgi:hypothetical protein